MGADNDVGPVRMAELLPGGAGQVPGPAAEGATPIDAGATADSEAPRPPAATVVQPETQAPRNPAASVLDDFLNTLVKLDSDAFFWEPVQEKDAPRYFDVVKHPMDIQTMREKVGARRDTPGSAECLRTLRHPVCQQQAATAPLGVCCLDDCEQLLIW